jgi:membrane protease YdiL (CAAX protease family)
MPPAGAWTCLTGLLVTLAVVGLGLAAGQVVAASLAHWSAAGPAFAPVAAPVLSSIYQLAFGWIALRWLIAGDEAPWRPHLGLIMPRLRAWHWVAIVIGLYAVKAIASIIAITLAQMAGTAPLEAAGGPAAGLTPIASLMRSNGWYVLLAGGVLAAMVEELVYRGYLSRTLEGSRLGFWGGALVAALLWAGLHLYYPLPMQGMLVVVGIALSYVRARTGSVYPGMAWHIINNVVGLIALRAIG